MNIGIVGTGLIVDDVAPNFASWGIGVAAVAGTPRSAAKVAEMAERYGCAGSTDWHDLIADDAIDTLYVAVPNFLHYDVTRAALEAGKDVVCEKPLAASYREAAELAELAKRRGRYLWEAVVTTRQPNFRLVRDELLPHIGSVKVVTVNYSQYSRRYDAFRAGEVLPAFDPAKAGGAIMDLGLYTLTYTIGLFGEPVRARYLPNVERNIDTSGVITLEYEGFTAVNVCAKDCQGGTGVVIQGTDGSITSHMPPNVCGPVTLSLNDGTTETYDRSRSVMWEAEFAEFCRQQQEGDLAECHRQLGESLTVSRIQNEVRVASGVVFPTDA